MKIAFLGDSVTASANVALTDRWAYKVGIANGYSPANIINAGIPGDETTQMLVRLQADVINHAPDVCVMMMTVNDKSHGLTLETHESNVRNIISQLRTANIKVVIASPPVYRSSINTWQAWVEKDQAIAGELNIPYIDIWREYSALYLYNSSTFNSLYVNSADLVHQSVAGNAKIAEVMNRNNYAGVFLPDVENPPSECPEACNELTLALADLQLNGATVARLDRVKNAL